MSARQPFVLPPPHWPVISVGRDRSLLAAREASLDDAGFSVRSLKPEQAEPFAHDGKRRVWIFCGSVEMASLVYLSCCIRRHSPESRLLLLERRLSSGAERCLFHQVLHSGADGDALVAAIQELAGPSQTAPMQP